MENFGLATVVVITVIAYLVGEAVKLFPMIKNNWIPVICGFVGGLMGVPAMMMIPDYPAQDPITAIAVGVVSGLAATGFNQIYKQIYPDEDEDAAE